MIPNQLEDDMPCPDFSMWPDLIPMPDLIVSPDLILEPDFIQWTILI